jgi:hypothetical protein
MPRRCDLLANIVGVSAKCAGEIVAAARTILCSEGAGALTMRRLVAEPVIQAPSLSKHRSGRRGLLIAACLRELDGRYPPGPDFDATWLAGAHAFQVSTVD